MLELLLIANAFYLALDISTLLILKKSNRFFKSRFFVSLCVLLVSVSMYALLKSGGQTVLFLNLILVSYALFYTKKRQNFSRAHSSELNNGNKFWFGLFVFNLLFFIHYFHVFDFGAEKFKHINEDYYFYSRVSGYLRDFGVENTSVEYFLKDKGGLSPYHYFELWFGALVSDIANLHTFKALKLIVFPILQAFCILGLLEILHKEVEALRKNKLLLFSISLLAIFCSGFNFLYPSAIEVLRQDLYGIGIFEFSKLSIVLLLLIGFYSGVMSNDIRTVSIYSSFIAINYITCVPPLALFCLLWSIYKIRKGNKIGYTFLENLPFAITSVLIFSFYAVLGPKQVHGMDVNVVHELFTSSYLKTGLNIILKTTIQIGLCLAPFVLLSAYFIVSQGLERKFIRLIISHFLLTFAGLISWALLHKTLTSTQLWTNIYIVSNIVFIAVIISLTISKVKKSLLPIVFVPIGCLFVWYCFSGLYEPTYVIHSAQSNNININKTSSFVYSRNKEAYDAYSNQFEQVVFGRNSSLFHDLDPLKITCISPDKIIPIDQLHNNIKSETTLIKHFELLKKDKPDISFLESQKNFIETYNIQYLLIEKDAELSAELTGLFEEKSSGKLNEYNVFKRKER